MWICSQQRRAKRNRERKHVRVIYGSPKRVLKWKLKIQNSKFEIHIPQRSSKSQRVGFFGIAPHAAVRECQTAAWRGDRYLAYGTS